MHGAPLGIKVSQIFGQLYLADFDRLAMRFFDIGMDQDKLALWTRKYIEARIVTASTPEDYADLCADLPFLLRNSGGTSRTVCRIIPDSLTTSLSGTLTRPCSAL